MRLLLLLGLTAMLLPALAQDAEEDLKPVPASTWNAYSMPRQGKFLVDPQGILRGPDERKRREFLEYHSSDSLIDLYVYLLKGDQVLPVDEIDAGERMQRWGVVEKPSVVVHYYMGRPDRARMDLSPQLDQAVPIEEQARALESSVERALTGASPEEQFEKFVVQMAIRIFRMERLLERGTAGPAPIEPEVPANSPATASSGDSLLTRLAEIWRQQRLPLLGGAGLLLLILWWNSRRRRLARHFFPEADGEERLGGPHGAGVGAIISFAKSSPPPAAQLEKLRLH